MKTLKKIFLSFLMMPIFSFAITSEEVHKVVKNRIDEGLTPGMVVGIIDESGTRFYKYGKMAVDDPTPVDENTVFETGSITKIFTSLLLGEMVEKGEVNLDDPVEKFLPKDQVTMPSFNGKKITLEHLSTHTGGFPYVPVNFLMSDMYNPFCEYSVDYLYNFLSNFKLPEEPGTQYRYSNVSIGLLGLVLSLKTNQDYQELLFERILKPLGMNDSKVHLNESMQKRFAKAHIRNRIVPHWDIAVFDGAGGMHSTAKDLARFIEANLGFYKTDLYPILQKACISRHQQDEREPFLDVGLEWNISYKYHPKFIYHGGATGGHQIFIGFCPVTKKGIVICSNSCSYIYDIGKSFLNENWHLKKYPKQSIILPMMLYKFVGEYKSEDGTSCVIGMRDLGLLSILYLNWGRYLYKHLVLTASTEKDFFVKTENYWCTRGKNLDISFHLNEKNEQIIDSMQINYNGQIYNFKKVQQ